MSDMSSERITVRIPGALGNRLRARSRMKGKPESELVREALENYLENDAQPHSAFDAAQESGLLGSPRNSATDLSTNPKYLEDFGKSSDKKR